MGFEWMTDAATISPFPEKKLTIKVPQRKKVLTPLSIPSEDITDPTENSYPTESVPQNGKENGKENGTGNETEIFLNENEPKCDVSPSKNLSRLLQFHDSFLSPTGFQNSNNLGFILSERTEEIKSQYTMGRELGRGHFGVVRQCERIGTGEMVACKSINKESLKKKEEIKELQAEIGIMERLQGHSNVVQLTDVFEDSEAVHLVMELCKEGDLFDYIARKRRLPEAEAAKIFRQVVLAVQYCHSQGVVHRDLKPENILFSHLPHEGGVHGDTHLRTHNHLQVKLADFGLAVVVAPGQTTTGLAGSPFYMAPELVRRKPYGNEIDVWSLGVILYTALSGFLPFWGKSHEQTFAAVCRGEADFVKKPWQIISPEAKSLVRKMLTMDPKRRATIDDILTHPWILAHCPRSAPRSRPKPYTQNPFHPAFSFQSQQLPPWSPREYGEAPVNPNPIPQALSAPKGQFSPPRTPSPQASPRTMPPKPSISQLMITPPGTPKKDGEHSHVTLFAAALAKPFRFLQYPSQQREREREREVREKEKEAREKAGREGGRVDEEGAEKGEVVETPALQEVPPPSPAQTTPRPFFLSEPFEKFSRRELILQRPLEGETKGVSKR